LRAIAERPKRAVGRAADVRGVEMQESVLGGVNAVARSQEGRVAEHQRSRQKALGETFLRAVEVVHQSFEQSGALDQTTLEGPSFAVVDQKGDGIELPRTVHPSRVAVHVVRDAVLVDQVLDLVPAAAELRATHSLQRIEEWLPVRPQRTGRVEQLV